MVKEDMREEVRGEFAVATHDEKSQKTKKNR